MPPSKKLRLLYFQGLEYQKQLDAIEMSEKFLSAKELGSFYEAKSVANIRLENNNEEFENLLNELNNDKPL